MAPNIVAQTLEGLREDNCMFRWLDLSTKMREKRFVRTASLAILNLHASERIADPDLRGRPLYEKIASKYLNITNAEARDVVERARKSFAVWPYERDLKLRDVARYIIVNQYIETHGVDGTAGNHFQKTICKIIAKTL